MLDKEILAGFREESLQLLQELTEIAEALEAPADGFPAQELSLFAQKIDRIMGAAQTLHQVDPENPGLPRIGAITQLCKRLGYRAAEVKVAPLVPYFAAFWADTLEVLTELIENLEDEVECRRLAGAFASTLQNRLQWLGDRLQKAAPGTATTLGQDEVEKLLKSLQG